MKKKCEQCGTEYEAKRNTSRFCKAGCRVAHSRNKVVPTEVVEGKDFSPGQTMLDRVREEMVNCTEEDRAELDRMLKLSLGKHRVTSPLPPLTKDGPEEPPAASVGVPEKPKPIPPGILNVMKAEAAPKIRVLPSSNPRYEPIVTGLASHPEIKAVLERAKPPVEPDLSKVQDWVEF